MDRALNTHMYRLHVTNDDKLLEAPLRLERLNRCC